MNDHQKIITPGDHDATIAFAAHHFIDTARAAIEERGVFYVALSGGSTPKKVYQELAEKHKNSIDWTRVHLFWSDERSVPPTSLESNYHMAMTSSLERLPIPPTHIHRMHAEDNIEENAAAYEKTIHKILGNHPFDLILLGMGSDGHTASLFPGTPALHESNRLVVANPVPQQKTTRMTFTYPLINHARLAVIYVLGKDKAPRLASLFTEKQGAFPIQLIGTPECPALFITDTPAAALLSIE